MRRRSGDSPASPAPHQIRAAEIFWRQKSERQKNGTRRERGGGCDTEWDGRRAARPGGTPQEISRGQVRASARSPRKHRKESPCPSGASQKKGRGLRDSAAVSRSPHWFPTHGEAPNRQRAARCNGAREVSPMPRWGMARMTAQPGAASAGAALPPANFLRRPSGTGNRALRGKGYGRAQRVPTESW